MTFRPGHARSHPERGVADRPRLAPRGRTVRSVRAALATVVLAGTLSGALVVAVATQAGASTIVTESFANATVASSNWVSGGTGGTNKACLTASTATTQTPIPGCGGTADPSGSGALRLTNNGTDKTGWALYNSAVPAASGLNITFNTFQFNGTGADGISFFLVPGTTNLTAPGSFGGYLGYGGGGTGSPTGTNGVTNGLLNVGLDVYGNNAWTGYDGSKCAAGSTSPYPLSAAGEPTASVPESVTVRGPGNAQTGYCYIANSGNLVTANAAHALDYPKATARAASNTVGVNIVVPPPNATGPVPNMTITLTFPNGDTYVQTAPEPPASFLPTTFKFGFAGSSGSSTEYHEINDLTVTTSVANPGVTAVTPAQTAAGTSKTVTISGINFTGATAVTVGGVAATSFTVNSNTSITATLPANATAGIYDVVVADGLASSNINSGDTFTYGASTTTLASSSNPSVTGQTVTYSATAAPTAASGTLVPTGNVEFLDGTTPIAACGGASGVAVNTSGVATCAVAYASLGTHPVKAVYLGDANYTGSTATVLTQTVNPASTTTTVVSSANPSVVGQAVTFTATTTPVAPASGTPTGNIEFLQGGTAIAACGGTTGQPTTGGVATCSVTYAATGTNVITATSAADANYAGSTSLALNQVVGTAPTTTTVTSSLDPSATGQTVTYTGTASSSVATPTGSIEFLDGGTAISSCGGATGVAVDGSGEATCAVTYSVVGTHTITAKYLGSATLSPSTATAVTQAVRARASTTTVTSSANPSVTGQTVTFTGTASGGGATPTGTMEFLNGGTPITGCTAVTLNGSGSATCATSFPVAGTDAVTASYLGSTTYGASSAEVDQTVNPASTTSTVSSSPNPSVTGQSVTLTATAAATGGGAGTPTGTMEFLNGATPISGCTAVTLNGSGSATCPTSFPAAGTDSVTAVYSGDANFLTSTSPGLTQTVNRATTTTTVASSVNPSVVGQTVTYTATATSAAPGSGTPAGAIEFLDGGVAIGACSAQPTTGGVATCSVTYPAVGSHAVTADYLGDADYTSSSSTVLTQVVDPAATLTVIASSVNPSAIGQTVTYTAGTTPTGAGAGTPTGTMEFFDGATPISGCTAVPLDGSSDATCGVTYGAAGTHSITATYAGDANFSTSTTATPVDQAVGESATTTAVSSSANPSVVGQPVSYSATVSTVSGTPTGTVEFFDGPSPVAGCTAVTLDAGSATCPVTPTGPGTHSLTATYDGDSNFTASTSPALTQTVVQADTTTTVTSSDNPAAIGDPVTYTATVAPVAPGAGTPTGNVEFLDGSTPIADCGGASGVTMVGGVATCTTSYPATGDHTISATYPVGDTDFTGSTSDPLDQEVDTIPTAVTASASPSATVSGQSTTLTATLPVGATGTVTFTGPGAVVLCAPSVTVDPTHGTAACSTAGLPVGADTVDVSYSGDPTYGPSDTTTSVDVTPASTTTTVTSSENPAAIDDSVTYTAAVAPVAPGEGVPSGNLEFLDGSTPIAACGGASGVTSVGGVATCTASYPTSGTHTITAVYLVGDTDFTGSTSNPLDQVVSAQSSTTSATADPTSTVFGQPTTLTATVPVGATGTVTFTGPGGVVLCAPSVTVNPADGTAACVTSVLPVGTDTVGVAYSGDPTYGPSSTTTPVTVAPAATLTDLGSSSNPSLAGDSVTYTATVVPVFPGAGTATGFVEFLDGSTPIAVCGGAFGVALVGNTVGQAQCAVTYGVIGSHTITAVYGGDTDFSGSTSSAVDQVVDQAPSSTAASASPASTVFGQPTTITATVPPGATGTVTFTGPDAVVLCTATVSAGTATCTTSGLPVGTDPVAVAYSGDSSYGASSTTTSVTVAAALSTTALVSAANPSALGASVAFTATVAVVAPGSGTPTGSVEFLDQGVPVAACGSSGGVALSGGHAVCAVTFPASGTFTLAAAYLGSTEVQGSTSGPVHQVVNRAATSVTATVSANPVSQSPVTLTATVTAGATGTVTFTGPGGTVYCTAPVVSGHATCVTSQLPSGRVTVTVAYLGDTNHLPSSTSVTFTVAASLDARGQGYWTDAADGGIFTFGNKHFYGSTGSLHLNAPAVGMASTPDDGGYWLVATDGGVFAFGDAGFYGSTGSLHLNKPIEGIAPTGDGKGYWMSASDGGIFAFGDATFHGSLAALTLNKPIVGMAPTPDGNGYWLVASDGGVFACGDAGFYGSTGGLTLNKPIVAMAATPDGKGYWLVATDGGVFAFGDAGFYGSTGSLHLNLPIVGMATSPTGNGYWLDASDGGVFAFGDAHFWGSMGGLPLNKPMVGMSI